MLVASLDFRCGPEYQHPTASADIAAGIRFLRVNASSFAIDPNNIGMIGSSSGGHLALFTAIQPDIEMHQLTPHLVAQSRQAVTAEVSYVIALWPVSDPLFRFHHAIDTEREELIAAHRGYFNDIKQMREASVAQILGEQKHTHLPPAMIIQPGEDANVPQQMTLDLLRAYQAANGEIDYRFMPGLPHAFAYEQSPATSRCERMVWQFIESMISQSKAED